jgi:LysR family transcriptional regulator (chromosome initiation inhibitor)
MHRFTFDHLSTLRALIEDGTFEQAARRLHITPSAVSQRVKAMEQSAGRVLVQRTTPVALTDAGQVVLRYARQVELLEADTVRALQDGGSAGGPVPISLAVNADSLATWFLGALAGVAEEFDLAFELHREDQEHTSSLLRSGAVLAAVTSSRDTVQGCVIEPLGRMRYRAVATPAFVARRLGPGLAGLAEAPVVTFDSADDLQDAFLRAQGGAPGAAPRHVIPASNDFARAVLLGLGWGLLPEQQCRAEIADGRLVQLAAEHPMDVPLYWQRWNLSSPLLDAVSAAVHDQAARALLPLTD